MLVKKIDAYTDFWREIVIEDHKAPFHSIEREVREIPRTLCTVLPRAWAFSELGPVPSSGCEQQRHCVWDLETVPDLRGYAAANGVSAATDGEVREAIA